MKRKIICSIKRYCVVVLMCVCALILLQGCSEKNIQLNERLIIQGMGIDQSDDECTLTLNVFETETPADPADAKEGSNNSSIITCTGKSVLDALTSISNSTGKQPMYSQSLLLVMGQQAARLGVDSFIDFFVRHYEARPGINLFVAKGKASDVIGRKVNGKTVSAKTISTLATSQNLNMNVVDSNLVEFVGKIQSQVSSARATALEVSDSDGVVANGTAIFNRDKFVDFLTADETKGMLLLKNKNWGGTEVINVENVGRVTYTVMISKCHVDVSIVDDLPQFNIKVKVKSNVYEIDNPVYHDITKSSVRLMEQSLSDRLKKIITDSIHKCIIINDCDTFDFGRLLLKKQPVYFKGKDWNELMQLSQYNVSVETNVDKMGQKFLECK